MALTQKLNSVSTLETTAVQTKGQANGSDMGSVQKVKPICPEDLTPLQRQRLDAAVMMLVDYLVSASSSS